jgi:hypothetical protein
MTPASWQPDPTGHHQFRWWDGASWTDHVSDNGQASVDPLPSPAAPTAPTAPVAEVTAPVAPTAVQPVTPPSPQLPSGGPTGPVPFTPSTPVAAPAKSGPTWWKIALPVLAVIAVGVVLFAVIGGGDDEVSNPFGVTETELTKPDQVATLKFSLDTGEIIRFRVESDDGVDPVVAIVAADRATSDQFVTGFFDLVSDEFDGFITDPDELFSDVGDTFSDADLTDLGSAKRNDALVNSFAFDDGVAADFFPALVAGDYILVVGSEDGEDALGKTRIIVEQRDGAIPGDTITDFSALDEFFSDGDDDFFSDEAFFSDNDPFTP